MDVNEFTQRFLDVVVPGKIFPNPGGGTSQVLSIKNEKVYYRRGSSTISVPIPELFVAYKEFIGQSVSTSELKRLHPAIFDSQARPAGHNCNTTFLFLALCEMGIVHSIQGKGVAGNPFFVTIPREVDRTL